MLNDWLPLLALLLTVVGWASREQQRTIEYLVEENRVLKEQLGAAGFGSQIASAGGWPDGNAPPSRAIESAGQVVATPVLGGLHHRYSRAA